MIDIFCNGVKITPMGKGLTLSLNGGIFADLVRSYSTSFDVVRTPDVNEALGLTGAIYNFLQGQLKAVPCDVCINGHNQYGTLQVESLTPTTASLTLYVVIISMKERMLEMTLPEVAWRATGYSSAIVPFGQHRRPTMGQVVATGTKFSEYQNGFESTSDVTIWQWQFPVAAVTEILNYINQQQPSLDLTPIASAMAGVNVLANGFFIPLNAPLNCYVEIDNTVVFDYQDSVAVKLTGEQVTPAAVYTMTFERAGAIAVDFKYYYNQTDAASRQVIFSGAYSGTLALSNTANPSSATHSFIFNANAGDVLHITFPAHWGGPFTMAANIEVLNVVTSPQEGDFVKPYEKSHIYSWQYVSRLIANNRPAFNYLNYYSSLPNITVREFLSALLKLCGLSATVSIETTEIEGTIDAMHPDNDINGTGGCSLTMADGTVVYNVEPISEGGSKNEIEVALWQAVSEPDTAAGNMMTAVVQNFEHSGGGQDHPTNYIDTTKSREGAMVLTTDATYNGNSVQQAYDAKGALYANFGQYLDDVRMKPTADITAWRLREWVLFPDIIYINGWRVYITESSIDTDTGFYTFKGILTE